MKTLEAETSPTCLSDQIKRLVKFQLARSFNFGLRTFHRFRQPRFLVTHPLVHPFFLWEVANSGLTVTMSPMLTKQALAHSFEPPQGANFQSSTYPKFIGQKLYQTKKKVLRFNHEIFTKTNRFTSLMTKSLWKKLWIQINDFLWVFG